MKQLFLGGIALEKDLEFVKIVKELEAAPDVFIITKAEQFEVVEMTGGSWDTRKETGKKHIGYDLHYICFVLDNGNAFYVEPSSYYPFTDANNPGMFNFTPYRLPSAGHKQQMDYSHAYSLQAVRNYHMNAHPLRGVQVQDLWIPRLKNYEVTHILQRKGGERERYYLKNPAFMVPAETWNNEHKVVYIFAAACENSGYRTCCQVDLVTGKIVG